MKYHIKKRINKIICLIVGSIYLLSGMGKVVDVIAFEMLIVNYGFESLQIFAPLIVLGELALGACLILWIKPKLMSLSSMVLLIIFTAAFAYAHFKNGITDCGCFGMIDFEQQSPFFTFIRNILLFGMSLFVFIKSSKEDSIIENWKKYSIIVFFVPIIFICGFTFGIPSNFYKAKQHQYLNKSIKETMLSSYLQTSQDNSYLIYCFSYTCPHCWNSIENYKSFKSNGTVDSIISISLINADSSMNFQDKTAFMDCFGTELVHYELTIDESIRSIIRSVPTSFYIENDTIKHIIESELPSPFIFQRFIRLEN